MIYVLPESPMLADVPVDETLTRPHGEAFQLHDRVDDGLYPATVAQEWDYSDRRKKKPGRPPMPKEVTALVLHIAQENPTWGYDRIQGALANLGHDISDQTVGNILKAHGIEPAPQRKRQSTWKTFLKAHWDTKLGWTRTFLCGRGRVHEADPRGECAKKGKPETRRRS